MGRIILSRNDDAIKTEKVVVGWDPPFHSFYAQIFNPQPEDGNFDNWEELAWSVGDMGGYPTIQSLYDACPDEVKDLLENDAAIQALQADQVNPASGSNRHDLS